LLAQPALAIVNLLLKSHILVAEKISKLRDKPELLELNYRIGDDFLAVNELKVGGA
jgi:hypothetical protein